MKMDAKTYDTLEQEMHRMFEVHRDQLLKHWRKLNAEYAALPHTRRVADRFRWDAMNALNKWEGGITRIRFGDLYDAGLTDTHIDTALRKIFQPIIAEFEVDTATTDLRA